MYNEKVMTVSWSRFVVFGMAIMMLQIISQPSINSYIHSLDKMIPQGGSYGWTSTSWESWKLFSLHPTPYRLEMKSKRENNMIDFILILMSCGITSDCVIFWLVNHGFLFYMLALGGSVICTTDHNISKLIAFSSSHQPPANKHDSCFLLNN